MVMKRPNVCEGLNVDTFCWCAKARCLMRATARGCTGERSVSLPRCVYYTHIWRVALLHCHTGTEDVSMQYAMVHPQFMGRRENIQHFDCRHWILPNEGPTTENADNR